MLKRQQLHMPCKLILLIVTYFFSMKLSTKANAHQNEILELSSLINEKISLPCNVTKHPLQHQPQAILWFRNELATGPPIFALDLRSNQQTSNNLHKSSNQLNQSNQLNLDENQTVLNNRITLDESNANSLNSTNEFLKVLRTATSFVSDAYRDRVHFNVTNELPSLTIAKVKEDDQGVYLCRIDYRWARTKSFTVSLQVIVPPKALYIKDKSDQRVYAIAGPYNEDDSIDLMCIAENGKPPPRLLWYLNQTVIDETFTIKDTVRSRVNGQQQSPAFNNLTQPSVHNLQNKTTVLYWVENSLHLPRLARNYYNSILTCQALRDHNSFTPKSISLRIDMHLKPVEVSIKNPKINLIAGTPVEVVCETFGSKPPADITWLINDKQINCNRNCTQTISPNEDEPSTTTSVLRLTPTVNHQNARLTCRANNVLLDQHYIQDQWILAVYFKPVLNLVLLGENDFAIEHHTIALQCNYKSNPPLINKIQWFFNGQLLSIDNKEMNQINNSLLIGNVSKSKHEGSYSCEAENALSIGKSNVFQLYIHNVPKCKFQPKVITVQPNQNVKLICEYQLSTGGLINHSTNSMHQSLANLTFRWTKQQDSLDSEGHLTTSYQPIRLNLNQDKSNQTINSQSKSIHTFSGLSTESILNLHITKPTDYGLVICEASNFVGSTEQPCKFLIKPPLERPKVPRACTFKTANHSSPNQDEEETDRINHNSDLFSSIHHHNKFNQQYLTTEPSSYSTYLTGSPSINSPKLNENRLLIIDCPINEQNRINNYLLTNTDSTVHSFNSATQVTYQLELWRENDDQNVLLITKKTINRPKFAINYSLFDKWLDQEFIYSIYISAYSNQGKSDNLLKITFNQPEQLFEEQVRKHFFKLIPYSLLFNDQNNLRNQTKLFRNYNNTRPFILLAGSLYKEKNQNEQLNMERQGSKKIGSTLVHEIGSNEQIKHPLDKLRKNSLEQSLEEIEQQAAAEEHRNQFLPSTNHQLNRISTLGGNENDGKLKGNRNSYPNLNLNEQSNLTLVSRLIMGIGISLICLTLFISVFCYLKIRSKQLLLLTNNETNGLNNHQTSIDNALDSKQSLSNSECAATLSSISATLLQQQSNLGNGTINSLFNTDNLNNLNTDHFIITGTGALLDSGANLTIYSNQPSTINYAETNHQNKLLLPDQNNLESKQYFHFNSPKCDSKLITPDLIELNCDSLQIVMEHQQKMYSELLSIEKPTRLHVEIDPQDILLPPPPNLTDSTTDNDQQMQDSEYGQHVFCVSTQV